MPRRERRKCSVCGTTGHNIRTCAVFLAAQSQKEASPQSEHTVCIDTDVHEDDASMFVVADTPSKERPKAVKKRSSTLPVTIRIADTPATSVHVVDLKDTEREAQLESIEVFRQKYEQIERRETVDIAALIREQKQRSLMRTKQAPAFVAVRPSVPIKAQSSVSVATRAQTTKSRREALPAPPVIPVPRTRSFSWRLSTIRLPRLGLPRFRFPTVHIPQIAVPHLSVRPVIVWVTMLTLFVSIPFPVLGYISEVRRDSAEIMAVSTEAFVALQASTLAAFTADMPTATQNLNTALGAFSTATNILETEHRWLQSIASILPVVGSHVTGRQAMLTAGHHMALGNTYVIKGIEAATADPDVPITGRLQLLHTHMKRAVVQYDTARAGIANIPASAIPKEYRSKAAEFQLLFGAFVDDMYNVLDLIDVLLLVLGNDEPKQYLVMFQNNHELRPTGGFMGSYAIVEVSKGVMSWHIPGGGTYDVQGQLTLNYAPPLPLQIVNSKWELQDANWWSHVPASAALIEEMYENSRGSGVDGVFFVNATVLSNIIAALGNIHVSDSDVVLSADMVLDYINDRKSVDHEETNEPKKVLSELVPAILTSLEESGQEVMIRLLLTLTSALNDRSIQLFIDDTAVQDTLRLYGWTGEIREVEAEQDYLHIVRTNLQGQKTDANIRETITLETDVEDTGRIINRLTITRKNIGDMTGEFYDATNISYLRTYVPKGSALIAAEGFQFPPEDAFKVPSRFSLEHPLEARLATKAIIDRASGTYVYDEFHKTVFANWMIVPRGESRTITLTYALPFTVAHLRAMKSGQYLPYTMMHQKQSGLTADVTHTIRFPESWRVYWQSQQSIDTEGSLATYTAGYERDMYYGLILETP